MIITASFNHGKKSSATSSAPRSVRILYQICRGDSRIARRKHHRQCTALKPPLCKGRETRPLRCRTRCDSSRRGRVTRPLYAPPICTAPSPPFKGDGCERRRWRIQRATRSGSGQNSVSESEQRILGTATGGHRGVASFDTGECA